MHFIKKMVGFCSAGLNEEIKQVPLPFFELYACMKASKSPLVSWLVSQSVSQSNIRIFFQFHSNLIDG